MAYAFASASSKFLTATLTAGLPLTFSAMSRTSNVSSTQTVISTTDLSTLRRQVTVYNGARNAGIFAYPNAETLSTTALWTASDWFHAAATVQTTGRAAFLNGGNKQSDSNGGNSGNTSRIAVGARYSSSYGVFMDGEIAEAAMWSVALTDDEVASLGKGFKPTRIRPQSLVFYAPLIRDLQDTRGGLTITPNGNIGRVNLLEYSEQFDNAYWEKGITSITANTSETTDPLGGNTADKASQNSTTSSVYLGRSNIAVSGTPIGSYYLKRGNTDWMRVDMQATTGNNCGYWINLSNGNIGSNYTNGTMTGQNCTVASVGNGWYRVSISGGTGGSTGYTYVQAVNADGSGTRVNGGTYYVWGAQMSSTTDNPSNVYQRIGAATDYAPTGSAITRHPRVY